MGNNQISPNNNKSKYNKSKFVLKKPKKFYELLLELERGNYDSEIIFQHIQQSITRENINQKNKNGETLLLWVIGNFSGTFLFKLVNLLLQNGADPNLAGNFYMRNEFYNNPQHFSPSSWKKFPFVIYQQSTPLFAMTRQVGSYETYQTIELLIWYGAIVGFKFNNFINYFQFHNMYDLHILNLLVHNGLDVTSLAKTYSNYYHTHVYNTPIILINHLSMMYCSKDLKIEILKYMIDVGNDLSYKLPNGKTFWNTFKPEDYQVKSEIIKYLESKNKNKSLFIAKECLICCEPDKQLCLTQCHHAVCCLDCFTELNNSKCPYCTQELPSNEYQLIKFISD